MHCKTIFFLVIDATLASDNPSYFRNNLLERTWKLIMVIDNKIRDGIHDKKIEVLDTLIHKFIAVRSKLLAKYGYVSKPKIYHTNELQRKNILI